MPNAAPSNLDPASVARLEGLQLRAHYIADGFLAGRHRGPYRGQSVEFAEHREYATGDDLRYVDWKVFGKTDRVYLKQFEAETNLACYPVLDVSESMQYRGPAAALSKLQYAECLAAALAHLVLRQSDSVGLATIDSGVREFAAASGNPAHLDQLIYRMEQSEAKGASNLDAALSEVAERLRRRSIVIVISDLLGDVELLSRGLRRLRHARHEVIVLQTLDPAELEFPFQRETLFRGLEGLPSMVAQPKGVRSAYLAAMCKFLADVQGAARAAQADYELARTDEPLDAPLRRLLTGRLRRR